MVDKFDDIEKTVKKLSSSGKPGLIDLIVSSQPTTPATIGMVGMSNDENVIVVPYYDNVPRPFYKDGHKGANGSV